MIIIEHSTKLSLDVQKFTKFSHSCISTKSILTLNSKSKHICMKPLQCLSFWHGGAIELKYEFFISAPNFHLSLFWQVPFENCSSDVVEVVMPFGVMFLGLPTVFVLMDRNESSSWLDCFASSMAGAWPSSILSSLPRSIYQFFQLIKIDRQQACYNYS